jgi:protein-L-isoaspartate(D-aspartate) O-methyltransferase
VHSVEMVAAAVVDLIRQRFRTVTWEEIATRSGSDAVRDRQLLVDDGSPAQSNISKRARVYAALLLLGAKPPRRRGARDFMKVRDWMVERQIAGRGVRDSAVLAAMRTVPRERFVPDGLAGLAYEDQPLPIGEGQTISQPYIVAVMTEAVRPRSHERALEVGTGSGYSAAVLAMIVSEVYTIESVERLAESARRRLADLGYTNVHVRLGDGSLGWPEHAPFDAIVVTAGGPDVPRSLLRQLAIGGRLVMPVGSSQRSQCLVRAMRTAKDTYERETLEDVTFVPLIGAEGWPADEVNAR